VLLPGWGVLPDRRRDMMDPLSSSSRRRLSVDGSVGPERLIWTSGLFCRHSLSVPVMTVSSAALRFRETFPIGGEPT
jgi:hypothetical protein